MRVAGVRRQLIGFALMVTSMGCAAAATRKHGGGTPVADFFPLAPNSHWEYQVSRSPHGERFRFAATVRQDDFTAPNGRHCRIVEEHYGDVAPDERFPIVYCAEGGFLHRVMSLEYRGESLEDNGLRSGEVKFLPTNLGQASAWEGLTNAYRLPDGSGFEVRQLHQAYAQPEPVEVPAGRFEHCARVETTAVHTAIGPDGNPVGPRIVYYYSDWYAPGVGLIRTEQRSATAEVLATIELVSYQIGRETPLQ